MNKNKIIKTWILSATLAVAFFAGSNFVYSQQLPTGAGGISLDWYRGGNNLAPGGNSNNILGTRWNSPIYFMTGGINRMVIMGNTPSNSGFVGMGTLTPAEEVHIFRSTNPYVVGKDYVALRIHNLDIPTSTHHFWNFQVFNNRMDIFNNVFNAPVLALTETGRAGIQTTSPTHTLDVNGTARVRTLPLNNTLTNVVVADSSGCLFVNSTLGGGADNDWLGAGSGQMYTGTLSDNVGIGTATPVDKLDVFGNIKLSGGTRRVYDDNNSFLEFGTTAGLTDTSTGCPYFWLAEGSNPGLNYVYGDCFGTYVNHSQKVFINAERVPGAFVTLASSQNCCIGEVAVVSNQTIMNSGTQPEMPVFISSRNSVFPAGTANAVIIGGQNLSANQSDAVFTSHLLPGADATYTLGNAGRRWTEVWATNGTIQTSDKRMKENIKTSRYGLKEIMQLNPVTYSWIDNPGYGQKIGLIAQEVQPVIKEIVKEGNDPDKRLGINYSELIPVIIKAIQEQQATIETQNETIKQLTASVRELKNEKYQKSENNNSIGDNLPNKPKETKLNQNIPNPFSETTTISYTLSENSNVEMNVYSIDGKLISSLVKANQPSGNYSVDCCEKGKLASGTYIYVLKVNGQELQKKMIAVK